MVEFFWEEIDFQLNSPTKLITLIAQIPNIFQRERDRFIHQDPDQRNILIERIIYRAQTPITIDNKNVFCNFVFFPEFTIPFSFIKDKLNKIATDIKKDTFISFCIEHITLQDYVYLLETYHSNNTKLTEISNILKKDNDYESIKTKQYVNCCLFLIKDNNGKISFYIQPKFAPAMLEERLNESDLYRGDHLFIFTLKNSGINITFLICFDFIYEDGRILQDLFEVFKTKEKNLDYIILLQCNPKPEHENIKDSIKTYYNKNKESNSNLTTIISINTSKNVQFPYDFTIPQPSNAFGHSSLVFKPTLSSRQMLDYHNIRNYFSEDIIIDNFAYCPRILFNSREERLYLIPLIPLNQWPTNLTGGRLPIRGVRSYSVKNSEICCLPVSHYSSSIMERRNELSKALKAQIGKYLPDLTESDRVKFEVLMEAISKIIPDSLAMEESEFGEE